jgi:hypothetical protein
MRRNLDAFERVIRFLLGGFALFAAAVLFTHPLARLASLFFALLAFGEGAVGTCWIHAALGVRSSKDVLSAEARRLLGLAAIQGIIGYEWFVAGWEKVSDPDFIREMSKTIGYFASQNPHAWYKEFLLGSALPNAQLLGASVSWGETVIGIVSAVTSIVLVFGRDRMRNAAIWVGAAALLAGMFLNANFFLAAAWTGPGTAGVNTVMFWVQAVLAYCLVGEMIDRRKARQVSRHVDNQY